MKQTNRIDKVHTLNLPHAYQKQFTIYIRPGLFLLIFPNNFTEVTSDDRY